MTYTYDQTIELLQRAVTEKGDGHKESHCVYANVSMTEPVCIAGHVLSYVGLLSEAVEMEPFRHQPEVVLSCFTPLAVQAVDKAQDIQDQFGTWGEALIAAKEVGLTTIEVT